VILGLSGVVMELRRGRVGEGDDTHKFLYLPPRSLLVLSGEARYLWSHGIAARKSDMVSCWRREKA
jgi:alkylated DNA repair dioxygenase AlkB